MKRDVSDILQRLIREKSLTGMGKGAPEKERHFLTSLGVPLVQQDEGRHLIDVTKVKVFEGLYIFVRLLTNDVIEQFGLGAADVMVRRKIDPHLTPEMASLGLEWVMVYARINESENVKWYDKNFGRHMQTVFSAIQTAQWGGKLFPEYFGIAEDEIDPDQASPALLFPFHLYSYEGEEDNYYFLVEYSKTGHFLRITIEDAATSRLQLKHIRHRVVDNLNRQGYLPDIHRIAEQINQGILRECQDNKAEYKETADRQIDLFDHLRRGGLSELSGIILRWTSQDAERFLLQRGERPFSILSKVLLLLEDSDVLQVLGKGHLVEMTEGARRAFLDVSRGGTFLNISLTEPRIRLDLQYYLDQMPLLNAASKEREGCLNGVRLFLIHHITAEVLGLIESFHKAGCDSITTFFVKYAGVVPDEYLETILSLPSDGFRFHGLEKLESRRSVRGSYFLSKQYSSIKGMEHIDNTVQKEEYDFLDSMRLASGYLFFKEAIRCRQEKKLLLLVEDGGYLAPIINRACLLNTSVGEVLTRFNVTETPGDPNPVSSEEMNMVLSAWLSECFIGSIEHTRNGFDYNQEIMDTFGKLQFPVCSIAVSHLKRGPEARECSTSIINAIESIFLRLGLMLSRRRALVLGSSGAIASYTVSDLCNRMGKENVCGVDIMASGLHENGCVEVRTVDEVPKEFLYDTDLIIGVIGKSILKEGHLSGMILHGRRNALFFGSGSTKTVEFKDLEDWLHRLGKEKEPKIGGKPVEIESFPIRDLQTGILQGSKVTITFLDNSIPNKDLYLLGGLTPINFLYYGIPREIIDDVMTQLMRVSTGMIVQFKEGSLLPPRLLAVDYEIDVDGRVKSGTSAKV
jgi:hypothetical protein